MPYQRSWKLATVVDDGPNGSPEFTWQEIETWIFHSYTKQLPVSMETINFLHCACCFTFPVYRKFKEETYHVHCLKLTQGTLLYSWIV